MSAHVCSLLALLGSGGQLAGEAPGEAPAEAALEETARRHYEVGLRHFNLAEYDRAIEEFREGYRISRAAGFLFNLGQAHRLKGDCAAAVRFYRTYLREGGTVANREQVEATLGRLEPCPVAGPSAPAATVAAEAPRVATHHRPMDI